MLKLNLNPDRRFLRQFAWASLLMMPLFGLLLWWRFGAATWIVVGVGAVGVLVFAVEVLLLPLLSEAAGRFAEAAIPRAFYRALAVATVPIGFVVSHVLMALIYYLVVTPIALVFRLMGRDELRLKKDSKAGSYWVDRGPERRPASYFKLY